MPSRGGDLHRALRHSLPLYVRKVNAVAAVPYLRLYVAHDRSHPFRAVKVIDELFYILDGVDRNAVNCGSLAGVDRRRIEFLHSRVSRRSTHT